MRFSRNRRRSFARRAAMSSSAIESIQRRQNSRLRRDRGNVVDGREGRCSLRRIGNVGVEQRQIELNVQRLFIELARQVHPGFRRVDVLVQD